MLYIGLVIMFAISIWEILSPARKACVNSKLIGSLSIPKRPVVFSKLLPHCTLNDFPPGDATPV